LGASVNPLFNYSLYTDRQIAGELAALRRTGATVARSDALWDAAELGPPTGGVHHYRWTFDDGVAAALAAQHLRWLPIVDYTPSWDRSVPGREHSAPRSPADFGAFAGALAARYGPAGTFWTEHPGLPREPIDTYEIWNEPDEQSFWLPTPDPAAYAELYLRARNAIDAVDPAARVVIGGLGRPLWFLPALLAARPGIAAHIDGVAIHPYRPTPLEVVAAVREDRAYMDAAGLAGVPLYVTEVGWTARPRHSPKWAPEPQRRRYVEQTVSGLGRSDCGIAAVVLYAWTTPQRDPREEGDWYGVAPPPPASVIHPSADAQAFTAGLRAAAAPNRVHVC
jgi:hypothetical protein